MVIKSIKARQIFDSRGLPTVACEVVTDNGIGEAKVPSGASTGPHEAIELRDGGKDYAGKGVLTAVANVNDIIAPKLIGMDEDNQREIDRIMVEELDGAKNQYGYNKAKLGANAILAVSMAVMRASCAGQGVPLCARLAIEARIDASKGFRMPVPSFNVINGGVHAGNDLPFQEFMILPTGAKDFVEAMKMGTEVYQKLKCIIATRLGKHETTVGDEGGFAPSVDMFGALDLVTEAIEECGYTGRFGIGMDCAAAEFYKDGTYDLNFKTDKAGKDLKSTKDMIDLYRKAINKYAIVTIEDPLDNFDYDGWAAMVSEFGDRVQIVGDDPIASNSALLDIFAEKKSANALLLKVNQIGTVSEALDAAINAYSRNWGVMVSHRSGETEDTFIADLAVGICSGQIKSGAPCRSERLAKYNRLLEIEPTVPTVYAGKDFKKSAEMVTLVT